ncbi:class I SAM-dependent methyltransferase [Ectobacillus sp. sgz5001026]|uniref:class I SAM-dependent methyltransferase n=1 Tax=Ectobacillus sp. sgz5001026 TaxID=3242473 RepID=UPI0036D35134
MNKKQEVQRQFGSHAQQYVTSETHAKGNDLTALLNAGNADHTDIVLDIATGGGHVANGFAPFAKQVIALDITKRMLEKAEEFINGNGHKNVYFVQGDAEQLPFPDDSFTIVACRIAPHHFPSVTNFVKESYRVLKENGAFLLLDNVAPENDILDSFYNNVEKKRDYSHNRAYKKSEWLNIVEEAGFYVQTMQTFSKTFPFESWCNRMSLPSQEKGQLQEYMLHAPVIVKQHFHIQTANNQVVSFQGQSILLHCRK